MKRCNLAPEVRNGVGIIHIFRGQEADTGRPRADAPVNELFQVCTEAVSISEVQIWRERERETSVLEDLHETGGSLFMFLMSFRFFTWNLALRLDTIKRWEKNLSVVSEADSRELLLESQVAAVLEHLAPGFWRLDGTSAEPGWDVFLRSASLLP